MSASPNRSYGDGPKFHRGEPTTLVMRRKGCTCFMTLGHDGYGYSLCREHEAEREQLNKAAPSGLHFGAGLSGEWIFPPEPMGK